jgi:hypothetical protein
LQDHFPSLSFVRVFLRISQTYVTFV